MALYAINLTEDYFHFFLSCLLTLASITMQGHGGADRRHGHYKGNTLAKMKKSCTIPFTLELVILSSPSRFQKLAININKYTF